MEGRLDYLIDSQVDTLTSLIQDLSGFEHTTSFSSTTMMNFEDVEDRDGTRTTSFNEEHPH